MCTQGKISGEELALFCKDVASVAHGRPFVFETPDAGDEGSSRASDMACSFSPQDMRTHPRAPTPTRTLSLMHNVMCTFLQGLGTREIAAIMMMHGCGSSPEKFELESGMNTRAEKQGVYNVYLEGTGAPRLGWNAGFSTCNTNGAVNDVDFSRAVALWMIENLCVDTSRLFAAGFSNGGSMIYNMSCEMSDTFAGFGFVGSTQPPSTYPSSPTCNGGQSLVQMKPMIGLCGSLDGCGSSILSWFGEFSRFRECTGGAVKTELSSTSTCWRYSACGAGRDEPLEYCMVEGLGHCWSGNDCCDSNCVNQAAANMDYSEKMLQFFMNIPINKHALNSTAMKLNLRRQLAASAVTVPI